MAINTLTRINNQEQELQKSNVIQFPNTKVNDTSEKIKSSKVRTFTKGAKKGISYYKGVTQPIKSKEKISEAKEYLFNKPERYETNKLRDYTMFSININIGRRIEDLLSLKISDVENENKSIKDYVLFIEKKTGKPIKVKLNTTVKEIIKQYLDERKYYSQDEYLFKSREGINNPISRTQAWKIVSKMGKEIGLDNIGTHSMRKTMGYQYAIAHKDDSYAIQKLSKSFNHSSLQATNHYLGFDQEEIDQVFDDMNL